MTGIALPLTEIPVTLLGSLADRKYVRAGQEEVQFHWWQTPTVLPVQWNGRVVLLPWGSKRRRDTLPFGGWVAEGTVKRFAAPEPVVIPAVLGHQGGTWFLIAEGVRGIVVYARTGPVVYMLVRPATNYYRNMTEQQPMMPVLVNQVI